MKKIFDLTFALILVFILSIPMLIIAITIKLTSEGKIIFWSNRVGKNNIIFKMPKFRTMVTHTPDVATHLLDNPDEFYIPVGKFLRHYSLDEIPQIYCIFLGYMSFVGPRPALYNQKDLISLRTEIGADKLLPGLTGWAQVNGRDDLSIPDKVKLDNSYIERQSIFFDIYIIWLTVLKVLTRDGVSH